MGGINSDPVTKRAYQREWIAKRRAAWFAGKRCVDCYSTSDLELDHVRPDEKITHAIWSWSQVRRDAETAKCVVRCYDCHLVRTAKQHRDRTRQPVNHGTIAGYLNRACRCDICKEFYRGWRRDKYERIGK